MEYTRQKILEKCSEAIVNPGVFYQNKFINYRGKTSDTNEYYTEVIADFVINNLSKINAGITTITREKSYKRDSHKGVYSSNSNRKEEIIAMQMFNQSKNTKIHFDYIGEIIDYQTPLMSDIGDKVGKIDLLAYDGKILHILELKEPNSRETMLRCVLEGYTYLKTVDTNKLLLDFNLPSDTIVKASPLVFYNSMQYDEAQQCRPMLKDLMKKLDSEPFYIITNANGNYSITK